MQWRVRVCLVPCKFEIRSSAHQFWAWFSVSAFARAVVRYQYCRPLVEVWVAFKSLLRLGSRIPWAAVKVGLAWGGGRAGGKIGVAGGQGRTGVGGVVSGLS